MSMPCEKGHESRVVDSRACGEGVRRRYHCSICKSRWSTLELRIGAAEAHDKRKIGGRGPGRPPLIETMGKTLLQDFRAKLKKDLHAVIDSAFDPVAPEVTKTEFPPQHYKTHIAP